MHVAALTVHPVKSLRGEPVAAAEVERAGLRGDRRWMLVDPEGAAVTARRHPGLLGLSARTSPGGGVVLTHPGHEDLSVAPPVAGLPVAVGLSRVGRARAAGPDADAWLRAVLGLDVRLVWQDDPARRPVDPAHGGRPGDVLSLADDGPVLVTVVASLRRLDEWVAAAPARTVPGRPSPAAPRTDEDRGAADSHAPLAMERFRPNLVVDGDVEPFAEDAWPGIRVGDVELRFAEHCDRCVMTTVDPTTLVRGQEPLRTLARHRRWDGKVWFGVRMVPVTTGRVAVGDPVMVLGEQRRGG
ncbi:MOSC domain-containing protein [Cellulomonas sp. 179-A 4D5 NHS]|uniref:MOSC domain-containing protein n=1 Tax=Cellulomonas sp. 179-A 4D5 NHS TaxID=3142378 RepID=UPI00399FCFDF